MSFKKQTLHHLTNCNKIRNHSKLQGEIPLLAKDGETGTRLMPEEIVFREWTPGSVGQCLLRKGKQGERRDCQLTFWKVFLKPGTRRRKSGGVGDSP